MTSVGSRQRSSRRLPGALASGSMPGWRSWPLGAHDPEGGIHVAGAARLAAMGAPAVVVGSRRRFLHGAVPAASRRRPVLASQTTMDGS